MMLVTDHDALIKALRKCRVEDGSPAPLFREDDLGHIAHTLLASGVVIDATTLADDDELVAKLKPAVRAGSTERFAADLFADDAHEWLAGFSTRAALRALAAALAERGEQHE